MIVNEYAILKAMNTDCSNSHAYIECNQRMIQLLFNHMKVNNIPATISGTGLYTIGWLECFCSKAVQITWC